MADYVLSILPSKLCAATALCSKLIFRFYNNEEHKYDLYAPSHDKEKIHQIFNEIGKIIPHMNGGRKRMISISFILKKKYIPNVARSM